MIPQINSVQIETIRECNFNCSFCPRSKNLVKDLYSGPSKIKNKMEWSLIESILNQVKSIYPDYNGVVLPFINGEPFLDIRVGSIIDLIRSTLPKAKVGFFTNGSCFTKKVLDSIKGKHIDFLAISLHTIDPERYQALTGYSLSRTLESMDLLYRAVATHSIYVDKTWVLAVGENTDLMNTFLKSRYNGYWTAHESFVWNYKGDISYDDREVKDIACSRLKDVTILSDGTVCLCCMDQNAAINFGNLYDSSLLDILSSDYCKKYRDQTGKQLHPCTKCNML